MKKTLLLLSLLLAPAQARPLTAEDIQTLPRLGECQMSPDGHWLAISVSQVDLKKNAASGELRIYPADLTSLSQKSIHFPKAYRPRWSPDGTRLLFSAPGATLKGKSPTSQVFVCATGTWKAQQITHDPQDSASDPVWAPDNRHIAFVGPTAAKSSLGDSGRLYDDLFLRRWNHYYDGRRQHIFVTELEAQSPAKDVTPGDVDAYPTSGTWSWGDNFCFSPDSQAILFAAPQPRGQARSTNYDIYRVELTGGARTNLTAANPAADMGPRLSPDGKKLLIVSHTRPGYESDFAQLRACPIDPSGKPSGDWVLEPPKIETGLGEFLPTAAGCFFNRPVNGSSHTYWLGHDGAEVELEHPVAPRVVRGLDTIFAHSRPAVPPESLHGLSCDREGAHWAALSASLSHPAQLVLGDRASGKSRVLVLQPFAQDIELGEVESVEVNVGASDQSMQMWIVKPPNFSPQKRWPLAFLVHGGPQGGWGNEWSLRWNAQVWAAQGFVVAMPNPHGSSGQTRAYQEEVSRDWGGGAYRDLMAGADYLAALPYVDSQRMVAAGGSYGGYMINWIAVHTGRFRALVTHCGIWNMESEYGTTDELWFADWEMGGPPWGPTLPPDYAKFSPNKYADKLAEFKTPHLVIHNDLDYRCPINQGLELFTALKTQGVEAKFLNFPDEGHWVLKPLNSLRWHREIFAFLKQHIQ